MQTNTKIILGCVQPQFCPKTAKSSWIQTNDSCLPIDIYTICSSNVIYSNIHFPKEPKFVSYPLEGVNEFP